MNLWDDMDAIAASQWGMFSINDCACERADRKRHESRVPANTLIADAPEQRAELTREPIYQKLRFVEID